MFDVEKLPEFNVLVVEDDKQVLQIIKQLFSAIEEYKCNLYSVEDGNKGSELISKIKPDMIITDYNLPGKDGCELAKEGKINNKDCAIICVTGEIDKAMDLKHNGVSYVMTKPFKANLFIQIINERLKAVHKAKKKEMSLKAS